MQNIDTMTLTEKQKNEIMHLDGAILVEVMHECADRFMTVADFHKYSKMPRRTIYAKIESGELQSYEVFGIKLILI